MIDITLFCINLFILRISASFLLVCSLYKYVLAIQRVYRRILYEVLHGDVTQWTLSGWRNGLCPTYRTEPPTPSSVVDVMEELAASWMYAPKFSLSIDTSFGGIVPHIKHKWRGVRETGSEKLNTRFLNVRTFIHQTVTVLMYQITTVVGSVNWRCWNEVYLIVCSIFKTKIKCAITTT
jgi:hypothetical protein